VIEPRLQQVRTPRAEHAQQPNHAARVCSAAPHPERLYSDSGAHQDTFQAIAACFALTARVACPPIQDTGGKGGGCEAPNDGAGAVD
jgi:hypothetical protein